MISSLRITNYALIRDLSLEPGPGFNIITGETGAGKSIILGALGLLRGNRVESRSVKSPQEKSVVEAEFILSDETHSSLAPIFAENDIDDDGRRCIMRRELLPSGRSRAFINDTPVTLPVMTAVADRLVDIHSQHKNLLLADSGFQLRVLDSIADNAALLDDYHIIYKDFREALKRFSDTRTSIARTRADADFVKYQLDEISRLNPVEGEEEELEGRREALAQTETVARALSGAGEALNWGETTAGTLLDAALASLQQATEASEEVASLAERLEAVMGEVDDIATTVSSLAGSVGDSPARLEEIDRRLDRLNTMMARHNVSTAGDLVKVRDSLAAKLQDLEDADIILDELEKQGRALKKRAMEAAGVISERRRAAAAHLSAELRERAMPLGLSNLVVDINVESGKLNADGCDTVDFRFAFNKNQQPQSIGATASGGEISRVMLALKSIMAGSVNLPTIIFDEIDTGVSGDVAARMGNMMAAIATRMQVITITHLPAVAARGDLHFKVFKRDSEESTETFVTLLDSEQRRNEIALMLGGNADDTAAIAAAESMLSQLKQ